MKILNCLILVVMPGLIVTFPQFVGAADPVGTAFTYQGRLIDDDKPVDGSYDFRFVLFEDEDGNVQASAVLYKSGVEVIDGYFTVDLDFGDVFKGQKLWLMIGVDTGSGNEYLKPLQPVNPTPYAIGYAGPGNQGEYLYKSGSNWIARKPVITPNPHDNMQPYQAVNFVIALHGIFPSRNSYDPFIGEIMMVGFNFAPRGWATCDGQLLPISQNQALFSLLGTTYGGDGRTTFGLPDLRGRVPVHHGNGPGLSPRSLGQKGGVETTHLTVN